MGRPRKENATGTTYTVAVAFKDAPEFQEGEQQSYEIGDDVSDFDSARLASLVERGIVKESAAPAQAAENKQEGK